MKEVLSEVGIVLPSGLHHTCCHPHEENAQIIDRVGAEKPTVETFLVIIDDEVRGMGMEEADSEGGEVARGEALEERQQPREKHVEKYQCGDGPRDLIIGHYKLDPINKPSMAQCHFQVFQVSTNFLDAILKTKKY